MRHPLLSLLICLGLSPSQPAAASWLEGEQAIMGTSIRVELWLEDEVRGARAIDEVMQEMRRIDALMSTYKEDSLLSRVNREAASAPVVVGSELFQLLQRALAMSELTGGAFDITYASVGYLYDFRAGSHPDQAQIDGALPNIDYRLVALDPADNSVRYRRPGVRVDLGGIAKGYAVERGAAILRRAGVRHGIVTAGGDSRIVGDRLGKPWVVGVRHPRQRQQVIARIPLLDEAISTSGDYERYFEEGGVRYHHIISPATGLPAGEVHSATIVGPDATMTDGLSTSVFVLGVARGLALIETLPEYEAAIVDRDGRLHYSSGFVQPE